MVIMKPQHIYQRQYRLLVARLNNQTRAYNTPPPPIPDHWSLHWWNWWLQLRREKVELVIYEYWALADEQGQLSWSAGVKPVLNQGIDRRTRWHTIGQLVLLQRLCRQLQRQPLGRFPASNSTADGQIEISISVRSLSAEQLVVRTDAVQRFDYSVETARIAAAEAFEKHRAQTEERDQKIAEQILEQLRHYGCAPGQAQTQQQAEKANHQRQREVAAFAKHLPDQALALVAERDAERQRRAQAERDAERHVAEREVARSRVWSGRHRQLFTHDEQPSDSDDPTASTS
jgi:hypothetical protein